MVRNIVVIKTRQTIGTKRHLMIHTILQPESICIDSIIPKTPVSTMQQPDQTLEGSVVFGDTAILSGDKCLSGDRLMQTVIGIVKDSRANFHIDLKNFVTIDQR